VSAVRRRSRSRRPARTRAAVLVAKASTRSQPSATKSDAKSNTDQRAKADRIHLSSTAARTSPPRFSVKRERSLPRPWTRCVPSAHVKVWSGICNPPDRLPDASYRIIRAQDEVNWRYINSTAPVDNSSPIRRRLLRQITLWSQRSGEVITRGSILSASGHAAAPCGPGSPSSAFSRHC
jgi:hypothetical protein